MKGRDFANTELKTAWFIQMILFLLTLWRKVVFTLKGNSGVESLAAAWSILRCELNWKEILMTLKLKVLLRKGDTPNSTLRCHI